MSNTIDLSGEWLIRADPDDRGVEAAWFAAQWPADDPTIRLPAAAQHVLGAEHRGVSWYHRGIALPSDWVSNPIAGQRLCLRFESVATDATVWVNGVEVGRHVGDYVPFRIDITRAAAERETLDIVIRVDQIHAPRPAPGILTENGHITKGFHDVLSLQHSGIWCGLSLQRTGPAALEDLRIVSDAAARAIRLRAEFDAPAHGQHVAFSIRGPDGRACGAGTDVVADGAAMWEREFRIGRRGDVVLYAHGPDEPDRINLALGAEERSTQREMEEEVPIREWSPEHPDLYTITFDLVTGGGQGTLAESREQRFAFRTITTGGPDNRHVLLNGRARLLRGVLHWGHEPEHIAPAPTPAQVRGEFTKLKALGFNCVCLCMWYPPEYYFDLADEMGMLIWQEHPVWKSPMEEERIPEYQRMFERFFRRDARHPSVVIVSGSCEHERIHPALASWWWKRGKELLPDKLLQVQTAFIGWTNPMQTDLHDEHVYDSSGRWVRFVDDVRDTIRELPAKPFVMGETIIGTDWVNTHEDAGAGSWWYPKGVPECRAFEEAVRGRYGEDTLRRFIDTAHRQNVAIRKFQSEVLRGFDGCAGWVMNQIADVPVGRLGFRDDFGRWRFEPSEMRSWLGDTAILLRTPHHRRGHTGGPIAAEVGVSNFGDSAFTGVVEVAIDGRSRTPAISCGPGDVRFASLPIDAPRVDRPTRLSVGARAGGIPENAWDVWLFPESGGVPPDTVRLDGLPYSRKELEPDFEERAYSSGWGLKCRSWSPIVPHPEQAAFKAPVWRFDAPLPRGTRCIISHRITPELIEFMVSGGRVVLLANKTRAGLGALFINVWGQSPLIIDAPPLAPHDHEWIADLLHIDLMERHPRAVPVQDLGIADQVDPVIRMVFTHDRGVPKLFDAAFRTRIGEGLLLATTVDTSTPAGGYLLNMLIEWAAGASELDGVSLSPDVLRGLIA